LDAFETVVLPRRIKRQYRITAFFYRGTWKQWLRVARLVHNSVHRESFLGYYGPLSLILLLGCWAAGLIFGFACVQYGVGEHVQLGNEPITFGRLIYHSGQTFFTLGYGDITPNSPISRALAVTEAGTGFGFLALVIGYLPVVYSAFSSREVEISLLDARAGSPPTASEFLGRLGCCHDPDVLDNIFRDWERWCADLLASHISYPVLLYFRSQHSNQSWLSALTVMLDVTSLVITGVDGAYGEQAKLTFSMARHVSVDLAQVVRAQYDPHDPDRLDSDRLLELQEQLARNGVRLTSGTDTQAKLGELRLQYEPYVAALSRRLQLTLPRWIEAQPKKDNWQTGPWDRAIQARALERPGHPVEEHF